MIRPELLLQKYLDGQCTPEEKKQLYNYLRLSEGQDFDNVLHALWLEVADAPKVEEATAHRMFQAISRHTETKVKTLSRIPYRLVAASLAGLCGVLYFFYFHHDPTFRTQYGEVRTLTLPDQTVVYLNTNSALRYARTYEMDPVREVWLEGEAYFEVTRQVRAATQSSAYDTVKLIVHTRQVDIEVTGTAFNVKNRHCTTQVVLDEGKVHLKKPDSGIRLLAMQPGEAVRINQAQDYTLEHVVESEVYSSWKENELYFDDQTLAEVQQVLADNYGVRLRFADPALQHLKFTGSTPADNLSVLMTTLEKSFSLTITQDHDEYIVTYKHP